MELSVNRPFDLSASLEIGQSRHWDCLERGDDGWYTGVICGDLVRIRQTPQAVESPTASQ